MVKTCLLCGLRVAPVISLGPTALANELPKTPGEAVETFPLDLVQCQACRHLQLSADSLVPMERLYCEGYVYVSDTSESNRQHFARYAAQMTERFKPRLVLDIGSNDGLFLKGFTCNVIGVDPAGRDGSVIAFFDDKLDLDARPDLITANNVMAHNANLGPMLRGVKKFLAPDGNFVAEVSYAPSMLGRGLFDLVYHEHIHHWTVKPAMAYFRLFGLEIYDAEEVYTHGGSLRLYARHARKGHPQMSDRLRGLLSGESLLTAVLQSFLSLVAAEKRAAKAVTDRMQEHGNQLGVLGWPAKACTLLKVLGLESRVTAVFDDNPNKIGRYTQYGHKIEPTRELGHDFPGRLLVGAWNYADELKLRFPQYSGRWLIPHPFRGE